MKMGMGAIDKKNEIKDRSKKEKFDPRFWELLEVENKEKRPKIGGDLDRI